MSIAMRGLRVARRTVRQRLTFTRDVPSSSMSALPRLARFQIRVFQARRRLPGIARPTYGRVNPVRACRAYVHADTLGIDVDTLDYVWRQELFPVDMRSRVVLDIGAHKGYFGLLALASGARAVISYEPESVNYGALLRATIAGRDPADWDRHRCAVGAVSGNAVLSISSESWSHSLHAPASGAVLSTESVPVVAFADVIGNLIDGFPGEPAILKLNVEGAAGDCLLSAPPSVLAYFEVLLIDLEPNTPQPTDDILGHIASAGFELVGERELVYHFVRQWNS